MDQTSGSTTRIHQGRNLKRFREMMGIKQETLAFELGPEWNQKRVSLTESREVVENQVLEEIAGLLRIPADVIRRFDEETALNYIRRSCKRSEQSQTWVEPGFNVLDKLMETLEALVLLHGENEKLYKQLLNSEREKTALWKDKANGCCNDLCGHVG